MNIVGFETALSAETLESALKPHYTENNAESFETALSAEILEAQYHCKSMVYNK